MRRNARYGQYISPVLVVLVLSFIGGCAHTASGPRVESNAVARDLGFPKCRVSIPLTQDEVLTNARLVGVSDPESQDAWAGMKAAYRPGDQLRFVSCQSGNWRGAPGYSFFGLFRGDRIVLEMYQVIDN